MAFDASAVYASKNSRIYWAPFASTVAMPADTLAYAADWGSTWIHQGYTQEGVTVSMSVDRDEIMVDQEVSPILYPFSGRDVRFSGIMAEYTATHIKNASGQGTITTVAAISGTRGHTDYEIRGEPVDVQSSWGIDTQKNDDAEAMRATVWKGQPVGTIETLFGVSGTNWRVPFEIRALPDTSVSPSRLIMVREVLPALP